MQHGGNGFDIAQEQETATHTQDNPQPHCAGMVAAKLIRRTWSNRVNFTKAHHSDLVQLCELDQSSPLGHGPIV